MHRRDIVAVSDVSDDDGEYATASLLILTLFSIFELDLDSGVEEEVQVVLALVDGALLRLLLERLWNEASERKFMVPVTLLVG